MITIEVYGRIEGAAEVVITRTEVFTAKNRGADHRLALVRVSPDGPEHDQVRYLVDPFAAEPDPAFDTTRITKRRTPEGAWWRIRQRAAARVTALFTSGGRPGRPARMGGHRREVGAVAGPLDLDREAIAELCRAFGVSRLAVFGSAVTDNFDPDRSDVDFLVEFREDVQASFKTYFGLKTALEELLGRPVDLVMPKALENPYFAATVEQTRTEFYAA